MRRLYTAEGERLPDIPWEDYPRPQLARRDWLCLNGLWELEHSGRREAGEQLYSSKTATISSPS